LPGEPELCCIEKNKAMKKLFYICITLIASHAFCQGTFPGSIITNPDYPEANIKEEVKEGRDSTKNVASVSTLNDALFPARENFTPVCCLPILG
jgi:hypothetical protein